jgi:hypothetical protein
MHVVRDVIVGHARLPWYIASGRGKCWASTT